MTFTGNRINMDYCTAHFGKKLEDLTFHDIENFFSVDRVETDQLEFKSINLNGSLDEKFPGIQKTVGAFLNSSGGLLIWGAPEGKLTSGKKEKAFVGSLTPWDTVLEKDFVVSKISDSIVPLPEGIRVEIIKHEGSCIVVIQVQTSPFSPHQTNGTYYMRIDGQTKPAPHHYIEALFRKVRYPFLEAIFKIKNRYIVRGMYAIQIKVYFYNWTPIQNEEKFSYRIFSEHGVFEDSSDELLEHRFGDNGQELSSEVAKEILHFGEPIVEEQTLLFEPYQLQNEQNKSTLLISFGGKYSPLKISQIILDFSKPSSTNPLNLISEESIQNKFIKDVQESMGQTRENTIKAILES
jgi:hypothetical protein